MGMDIGKILSVFRKREAAVVKDKLPTADSFRREAWNGFWRDGLTGKDGAERYSEVFQKPIGKTRIEVVNAAAGRAHGCDAAPAFKSGVESDGFAASGHIHDDVWSHYTGERFIGWQACAMLAQNPIIHLACKVPADDAVACGWKTVVKHDNTPEDSTDDLKRIATAEEFAKGVGVADVAAEAVYKMRVFGSSVAVPIITRGGKRIDMSSPFNADGLRKGDRYDGWKVVDPYWLSPQFDEESARDPLSAGYMSPTWYKMPNGERIHRSWFVKTDGAMPSDLLKPTYMYFGVPLTQQIYKRVWCAEKTANEAPLLAMSKRMLVMDADIEQLVSNGSKVRGIMERLTHCRNNWGVLFKRPGSEVSQVDTSLSDFEDCMFSQYQLVAAIAQVPATKILQTTPKGFNSTGEFEWRIYAQLLKQLQERAVRPLLRRHYEIYAAIHDRGTVFDIAFNPVDAPNERDRADIESTKANTRATYVQNQILTPDEVRQVIRADEAGEYTGIAEANPDAEKQDEEADEVLSKMGIR